MKYLHGNFVVTTVTTDFQDPKTTRRQLQDVSSLILSQSVALRRQSSSSYSEIPIDGFRFFAHFVSKVPIYIFSGLLFFKHFCSQSNF